MSERHPVRGESRQVRRATAREGTKPTLKAVENQFPKVRITGGPSPANIVVEIDGKPVDKVFNIDLHAGIDSAVKIEISQYVEVDVEMEALVAEGFTAVVRRAELEGTGVIRTWTELGRGKGKTLKAAVLAAAQSIPEVVS